MTLRNNQERLSQSTNPDPSTRRSFIKRLSATTAAGISLPRLVALGGLSAMGGTGCMGETTYDEGFEPYWTSRADQIEAFHQANFGSVYTEEASGYPDKIGGHLPVVTVDQTGLVTAQVNHPMTLEHWVTTVYMRDFDTGRVFYLKEFMPLDVDPGQEKGVTVQATLPLDVANFGVFAYCNLHDLWMKAMYPMG